MNSFLPDWIKGLYSIVSVTCRFFYDIFRKIWHVISFFCVMLVAFFAQVMAVLSWLLIQFQVVLAMLGDATDAADAAFAAGWPAQLFGVVAWCNHYAPVAEMAIMALALLFVYGICSLVRMIKSFAPSVA